MASFSAAAKAAKRGVRSVNRLPPGGARSSERTRSGRVRATSTATPAPNEDATRWQSRDAEVVERVEHVGHRVEGTGGWPVRLPEATQVEAHGVAGAGQPRPLRVPHPAVGDAGVHQHDGSAARLAVAVVGDAGGRA